MTRSRLKTVSRTPVASLLVILATALLTSCSQPTNPTKPTVLIVQTYFKAFDGQRANLAQFITTNIFSMDQKALEMGVLTHYQLLENTESSEDWDFVIVDGYPQADGAEAPEAVAAYTEINRSHKNVLVEGKSLLQLGAVVRQHRLKLVQASKN